MHDESWFERLAIPAPCPASWDAMPGDDRARSCSACGKSVHNLSAMAPDPAAALVCAEGDDLCVRLARDVDGKIVFIDSASSPQPPRRRWSYPIHALMTIIASVAGVLGLGRWFFDVQTPAGRAQPGSQVGFATGKVALRHPNSAPN